MKFKVQRDALLRPLLLVTGVVERRHTLPILANLLVDVDGDQVRLTGTDLEVELVARASGVEGAQSGRATIPARKLADIWRSLPDSAEVSVEVEEDRALIRSGRSRFSLASLSAEGFPGVEGAAAEAEFTLSQAELQRLIDETSFSMAQQDVRYYFNGLLLEVDDRQVRAVATDGHRMAIATRAEGVAGLERMQVIIPRKGVMELGRLLGDGDEPVTVSLGRNHLQAQVGNFALTTKLVEGRFPDYERVVPKDCGRSFEADRDTLKQAFMRASILSNEKYRGVRLLLEKGQLTIQANNPEQDEAEEVVPVAYDGDKLEISFNVSYLLDVLNVIDSASVKFSVSDANGSALIEAIDDSDALYIVMPMRL
jgi:DNA polymerase III subunit beta